MAAAYAAQAALYSEAGVAMVFGPVSTDAADTAQRFRQAPFLGITLLLSIFQFSLGTSITAETTTLVPAEMKGTLLGMEHSLFAVARVFGPSAGVALLTSGGISGLSFACAGAFAAVLGIWVAAGGGSAKAAAASSSADSAAEQKQHGD